MKKVEVIKLIFITIAFIMCVSGCNDNGTTDSITKETEDATTEATTETTKETDAEEFSFDPVLEKAIREKLGYDDETILTDEDLENVTSIEIFYEDIQSLDGISKLTNLSTITISGGNITDIGELALLENLTMIDIYGCLVKEIPDFSNCSQLTDLHLAGNLIEDVTPLQNIESIKYVNLTHNRIQSIEPLSENTNLESLSIDSNCILDYYTIEDNKGLIAAIDNGSQATYEKCLETENLAKAVVATFPKELSELELEKYIYQYVMDNMEYELVYRDSGAFGYYALTEGIGVCGDYAELFCLLARHAGLEAYTCVSETHAWNIVVIDGEKYHCDSLWDEGMEEWIYFNLSGEEMGKIEDHSFDELRY